MQMLTKYHNCDPSTPFHEAGLAFSSVADNRRLLERHVQTSKICLLLLLNLLKSTTDLLQICVYDGVECRSRNIIHLTWGVPFSRALKKKAETRSRNLCSSHLGTDSGSKGCTALRPAGVRPRRGRLR